MSALTIVWHIHNFHNVFIVKLKIILWPGILATRFLNFYLTYHRLSTFKLTDVVVLLFFLNADLAVAEYDPPPIPLSGSSLRKTLSIMNVSKMNVLEDLSPQEKMMASLVEASEGVCYSNTFSDHNFIY